MAIISPDIETASLYINGEWVSSHTGKTFFVYNPATGKPTAEVSEASVEDVDRAVQGAKEAFADKRWRGMTPLERGRILHQVARLIQENQMEIAQIMTRENGMPINMALFVEIPMVVECFDYMASLVAQPIGQTQPFSATGSPPNHFVYTVKEPLGVAGLITPWNLPLLMPAWKIAPALASGCSAVLKPAPETPLTALKLAELCQEAGVPDGVLQVLPGGDEAGKAIVSHPDVPKIAFTGETATGRKILAAAAPYIKRVTLELGGKSPNIIFADADIEQAAKSALFGLFLNSGQVCQAGSRIFVQESVYESFVKKIADHAQRLTVGPGDDLTNDLGPVVSHAQFEKVNEYIEIGLREGAKMVTGGKSDRQEGYFIKPTIFADVKPDMRIAREEIFGPVGAVLSFENEEDVIEMANNTIYGLAAAVWTKDLKRGLRLAQEIQSGTIWVNTYQVLTPTAPFGGFKQSGLGRELGPNALDAYLETKSVIVDLNDQPLTFF
ncbi:aldehyde dehydrogenase [Bacillus sp. V59.32b]|uniref:aldehyde dehydrogenase family protein n=1 Tax=Bacillus sp. V59.32b TaxID=1758642 RepID=UPI000E3CE2C0|nr:aldehyde dehydrogenase family protein [Bacillus sp. V59.32b]RFU61687.1 aldehyde dehydrogenase family protein [Bacillus sp. V59.32b]